MTGVLFREWLHALDIDMRDQKRNIGSLFDNASMHTARDVEFKSVKVVFIHPNTTSKLQPMDAGIIASFKRRTGIASSSTLWVWRKKDYRPVSTR